MRNYLSVSIAAYPIFLVCLCAPVLAQSSPSEEVETPVIVGELFECRQIADPDDRLACFDREVDRVFDAQDSRELVIVDREQIQEARRSLFGLTLPDALLFGGADGDEEGTDEITATLANASRGPNGLFTFELEDGARWLQTDRAVGRQRYNAGDTIVIKRSTFGSFRAKVNGRAGIRVRRIN